MHQFACNDGVFRMNVFDGCAVFAEDAVFELGRQLVQDRM